MPRGFARDIMKGHKHNIQVSIENVRATQHGVYDPKILCAKCDGILGAFDDYAIETCRRFKAEHVIQHGMFSLSNVDGDKFTKFVLAVLWRASISTRVEFKKVALGPYESLAQKVLFGAAPLTDMCGFEVMLSRYTSRKIDVEGIYTLPAKIEGLGVNGWGFAVSGFRFIVKVDGRPWPELPTESAKEIIVNGNNKLAGVFYEFEGSVEHKATLKMAIAHLDRSKKRN